MTTAMSSVVAINVHGSANRSMRWFTHSSHGGDAIQPMTPRIAPPMAATVPTIAPFMIITSRSCRALAPIADSRPSWRWRRWATTTKPAAATNPTSAITSVIAATMVAVRSAVVRAAINPHVLDLRGKAFGIHGEPVVDQKPHGLSGGVGVGSDERELVVEFGRVLDRAHHRPGDAAELDTLADVCRQQ